MSEVARKIGLPPARWWNYETARRPLDGDIAARFVETFKDERGRELVDFNWIYAGDLRALPKPIQRKLSGADEMRELQKESKRLIRTANFDPLVTSLVESAIRTAKTKAPAKKRASRR